MGPNQPRPPQRRYTRNVQASERGRERIIELQEVLARQHGKFYGQDDVIDYLIDVHDKTLGQLAAALNQEGQ